MNNIDDCGKIVFLYMIKILMFWMCENKLLNFICVGNLKESIGECLIQFEEWIRENFIFYYFILECNFFERNFRLLEKVKVFERLLVLKSDILKELLRCLFFKVVEIEVSVELFEFVDFFNIKLDDMKI